MKVVILAGGMGSRLSEETRTQPKPLVEIGGRPILWHIMMHYSSFGFNEFIVALGYKGECIRQYMLDNAPANSDLTVNTGTGEIRGHGTIPPDWTVQLVDTGLETGKGGRIKRLQRYLGDQPFMMTFSDGLSNVNLKDLVAFHNNHRRIATVTAVHPPARFGHLHLKETEVVEFHEKPNASANIEGTMAWINGGFFVLQPGVFEYISGDSSAWEQDCMVSLVKDHQLMAYRHSDFWQCMDTVHDREILEKLWQGGSPPWKVWE